MYFKLFKPQDWRKRSAEARGRNCAGLPQHRVKKVKKQGWANPSPAGNQNDQCRNRDTINTPMMDTTPMTSVPSVCVL